MEDKFVIFGEHFYEKVLLIKSILESKGIDV